MTRSKRSYVHRGGTVPLLGETIPEHFAGVAARFPDREAVVSLPQDRRLTYKSLSEEIDRLARGLVGLGFEKGDRVGIWATDNLEWLLLQMATARVGIVLVNINPAYRESELAYALKRSEVQGLFLIPAFRKSDYVEMIADLVPELKQKADDLSARELPKLRRVVLYDPKDPGNTARPLPGFVTWQEALAAGEKVSSADLDAITESLDIDDAVNIQYTSARRGSPRRWCCPTTTS